MFYYCTCSTIKKKQKDVNAGRTPFREVKADKGVCIDCGYYAVAYFERIDADEGRLYDRLFDEGKEFKPKNITGGSSLKIQKELKKRKKRGTGDSSGKNKDGNLDVQ